MLTCTACNTLPVRTHFEHIDGVEPGPKPPCAVMAFHVLSASMPLAGGAYGACRYGLRDLGPWVRAALGISFIILSYVALSNMTCESGATGIPLHQ